jgi:phosphatidylethanolamine/phosphatidyl-N-methylethanolamine N-methyltransferase
MPSSNASLFCREFLRSFHTTGAILPSGKQLARALSIPVDLYPPARKILEAGPGTGAVTSHLVEKLEPGDELVLCELNSSFADHLESRLEDGNEWSSRRNQVSVVRADVREVLSPESFHAIVSGLPLNNFDPDFVRELLTSFLNALLPGGTHTFFEYQAIRAIRMRLDPHREERKRLRKLDLCIRDVLSQYSHEKKRIFLNVPPAWAHVVRKPMG